MSETEPVSDTLVLAERAAGLAAGIGAVVLFSAVVLTITGWMGLHNVVLGAVIALAAAVHALRVDQRAPSIVLAAIVGLLGLWTIASPFVFGVDRGLVTWINVGAGALVVLLAGASAYGIAQTSRRTEPSDATNA